MKRKIRVSKTLSVILLSVALVLCAWRIWYVNATAYSFETQEYGIGEWIPLNGDFFYSKEENTNGYSVRVREAEVVRYEDFIQRFGKPVDYLAENTQHDVVLLTVDFKNENNTDGGREIEAALPRELSGEQQLALVRAYVKDNFVDKGMCADFAIHDKGTGNPHVHIMLTLRPLKENGQWGAKCRKAYDLDENGQRIPDGKGGWKNHREDTTDWNDKGNVEIWRAAWAAYTNRALESAGRPERIDHRSYKRQGIDKIPSVHLGPAASQMEKRGIRTDKGEVNRQIAADNKLLKEIKARITRLYRWSKDEAEKPQTQQSSLTALWEAQQQLNAPRTRTGKIRALQESAALFSFLQANGIQSMQQLHEKIADINSRYYDLRGKIVKAERRIATLTEHGEMWEQYNQYKSIHKQLAKVKPEKREQFEQRHSRELILYDAAARYLKELKDSGEGITPKAWQREIDQLTAGKQTDTLAMKSMREDLKAVERLRKTAEQLSRQERDKPHDREPER